MTQDKAIAYCNRHKDQFIRDSGSIDEGLRQFNCLVTILEDGAIKPEDLPAFGMDYKDIE